MLLIILHIERRIVFHAKSLSENNGAVSHAGVVKNGEIPVMAEEKAEDLFGFGFKIHVCKRFGEHDRANIIGVDERDLDVCVVGGGIGPLIKLSVFDGIETFKESRVFRIFIFHKAKVGSVKNDEVGVPFEHLLLVNFYAFLRVNVADSDVLRIHGSKNGVVCINTGNAVPRRGMWLLHREL